MKKKLPDKKKLLKMGVPQVLIPGIILAATLGWAGWKILGKNYYGNSKIFPTNGTVRQVTDGDTFTLDSGMIVRMAGVDAPNVGDQGEAEAKQKLENLIGKEKVWLEYDRYQDDKYGRILAWVWIDCEGKPEFLPANYMHKTNRESNPGLMENPAGCKQGKLVQEEMIQSGQAKMMVYQDRGELKYERRLRLSSE
jgi:endonuclease YncB( thermonuclease family)